jgi:hypothetical protein
MEIGIEYTINRNRILLISPHRYKVFTSRINVKEDYKRGKQKKPKTKLILMALLKPIF